ncbi:MAG: transposase [Bdellovibrionota bacterium]|nr:MAG: transposase [Bdellovibrionota bacterium]
MGQARSRIFDPKVVGTYHCMSRCVRRAYLCGVDPVSKRSFDHRKQWIKDRLGFLTQVFSIELISYVVMSNHLHTLIRNRPDKAALWSSEEVARRWRALFPKRQKDREADEAFEISLIAGNQELVELYRARLSNISWFNPLPL